MKLNDMDFIKLLPAFMSQDDADIGLSKAVDSITEDLASRIKLLTTWDQIDNMSAAELDLLADELRISWYDKTAVLDVKRQIIKESDMVHAKLGTNWAVKQVINTYFGDGNIVDWYDYDGEPYHFKIQTVNQTILNSKAEAFLRILNAVKRKSAVLDSIELISDGQCGINVFISSVVSSIDTSTVQR